MAKLTLTDLANLQNEATAVAAINDNNTEIEAALENTISRDGTAPNTMSANLDMNSNRVVNLPAPAAGTDALRLLDLQNAVLDPTVVIDVIDEDNMASDSALHVPTQQSVKAYVDDRLSSVTPEAYGAVGDGSTDDTTALDSFFTALAAGAYGRGTPGATYKFSQLSTGNNVNGDFTGCVFRSDGTLTGANTSLTIGNNCHFDGEFKVTTPGTETNDYIMEIGDDCSFDVLSVSCDAQHGGSGEEGVITEADNLRINKLYFDKIDRPLLLYCSSASTQTTGTHIGVVDITSYVRGIYAHFTSFSIGEVYCRTRSANASYSAGHNGVLIAGCRGWSINSAHIEDAGEHAFRIGGSSVDIASSAKTADFNVGKIFTKACGGCSLKINPTYEVSTGVTETCDNWAVGEVIGVDVGDADTLANNKELLRLSHVRNGFVGQAAAYAEDRAQSAQYLLACNDLQYVTIGSLGGTHMNGTLNISATVDADESTTFADDVNELRINSLWGVATNGAGSAIAVDMELATGGGSLTYGNIFVNLNGFAGYTTYLVNIVYGTLSGKFNVTGTIAGTVLPQFTGTPDDDDFFVNVSWEQQIIVGKPDETRALASGSTTKQFTSHSFDAGNVTPNHLYLNATGGTAGSGNYGSAIEFSRVGTSRRAAAIALKQATSTAYQNQLDFFVGGSGTATDAVLLRMSVDYLGRLILPVTNTPSSASDTGTTGMITWDSSYLYVCTATDTWKRVAISTW